MVHSMTQSSCSSGSQTICVTSQKPSRVETCVFFGLRAAGSTRIAACSAQ